MKERSALLIVAALAVLLTPISHAAGHSFLSAKVGRAAWPLVALANDQHVFAYSLQGGYRWRVGSNSSFGWEAGYTDFGRSDWTDPMEFRSGSDHDSAMLLGATYRSTLAERWYITVGLGLSHARFGTSYDIDAPVSKGHYEHTRTGNGGYIHAGIGYDFSPGFGLSINYGRYRSNIDYTSTYSEVRQFTTWFLGLDVRF